MLRNSHLHSLLAALFAVLAWLSPVAAQPPPQVPGVQLEGVTVPAPHASYTLTSNTGHQTQLTYQPGSVPIIPKFEVNGREYVWNASTNRYYLNTPGSYTYYKFVHLGDQNYTYIYVVDGELFDNGTASKD